MREFRLLTTDFLSHHFVEPIAAKLVHTYPEVKFSLLDATVDREPEIDAYFLAYQHLFKDFRHEVLLESDMHLWASASYLEKRGTPRNFNDLLKHTFVRPQRSAVELKFGVEQFGTIKNYPPYYHNPECVEVDTLMSLLSLGEKGVGIVAAMDFSVKKTGLRLERIPSLEEETEKCYRKYVVGYHEKHKDSPIVKLLMKSVNEKLFDKK